FGTTIDHSRGSAAQPQRAVPCQPGASGGDGGKAVLVGFGASQDTVAGIRGWSTAWPGLSLQDADPRNRQHDHGVGRQLYGLGQTPAAQGGGQVASAAQPAKPAAGLCGGG